MENKYTQKQLEILETSIKYMSDNGVQAFSLRNIAQEIGIKQPTLYGHFKSKEEILRGIFDLYKSGVETYHKILMNTKATKITKIRIYFKKMCEFIQYKPNYMNLVMLEFYQYRSLFKEDLNFLLNNMKNVIENTENDENFRDDVDYEWLVTSIEGILHIYLKNKLTSENFDVLANADLYWDYLESLIKK